MAHKTTLKNFTSEMTSRDAIFIISNNNGKLGELMISKGDVKWKPFKKSAKLKKLTWAKFSELFESNGTEITKSKLKSSRDSE